MTSKFFVRVVGESGDEREWPAFNREAAKAAAAGYREHPSVQSADVIERVDVEDGAPSAEVLLVMLETTLSLAKAYIAQAEADSASADVSRDHGHDADWLDHWRPTGLRSYLADYSGPVADCESSGLPTLAELREARAQIRELNMRTHGETGCYGCMAQPGTDVRIAIHDYDQQPCEHIEAQRRHAHDGVNDEFTHGSVRRTMRFFD